MRRTVGAVLIATCSVATAAPPSDGRLDLSRRVILASQLYASILGHFGHWRGVPGLDLDKAYQAYVREILASDLRREFDLASMEFIAKLRNGHSGFDDQWLRERYGQRLGFYAHPIDGRWTVTRSELPSLKVGDVITAIDGHDFEGFYRENSKYVSASDERWSRRAFFESPFLFPASFTLGLEGGRQVRVTRSGEFQWAGREHKDIEVREDGGIAYIRVPSFSDPRFERASVETLSKLRTPKAVILDLRGNHGGSTPTELIRALMDRPWRWWADATPLHVGILETQEDPGTHMEAYSYYSAQKPAPSAYGGPLYLLVDGGCFSACEDLLVVFKDNHRAVIVGERTAGSSGQPYGRDLGDGMGVGLGAKRMFFPDGSEFEGVGVAPDVEVRTTVEDLKTGRDPVLVRARTLIDSGLTTSR